MYPLKLVRKFSESLNQMSPEKEDFFFFFHEKPSVPRRNKKSKQANKQAKHFPGKFPPNQDEPSGQA